MLTSSVKNAAILAIVAVVIVVLVVLWIIGALASSRKAGQKLHRRDRGDSSSSSDSDDDYSRFKARAPLVEGGKPKPKYPQPKRCDESTPGCDSTTTETPPSYSSPSTLSCDDNTPDSEKIRDYDRHHHKKKPKKKHHRKPSLSCSTDSSSSSSSCSDSSSSSGRSDEDCIGQGIGQKCWKCEDCACGLACENKKCVCPKPPAPTINLQAFGQNLMAMWTPVPGADFYNITLYNSNGTVQSSQQFFTGVMATFNNLPSGTYYITAYSGSHACGSRQTYSQTLPVVVGPTPGPGPNPPPNGETPVITGVTLNGSWPGRVQLTFQTTGAPDDGINTPRYSFSWRAFGGNNQQVVSGQVSPALSLPGARWPLTPVSNFPSNDQCAGQPCCAPFLFGCPAAGCTAAGSGVSMELLNVTVTNASGRTSLPTCWRVTSMCLPGPQQLTPFQCP